MTKTALDQFWQLVVGAIALNPQAFQSIESLSLGNQAALFVLLLVGFSLAIGQGIVLFINRVKPIRFILSLIIAAVLFVASTGFWILSTWLVSHTLYNSDATWSTVFRTLGLAQAPQILGCFIALPYLGVPISVLLSLWTLLAFVIGFDVATGLSFWQSFGCAVLGWGVFQILQRTIGRPAAVVSRWLSNTAAGVNLVTSIQGLEQLVEQGPQARRKTNQTQK